MKGHEDVTEIERDAAAAPTVVSRWAIHRRLYDWVLSFAHHKHSTTALFTLSFAESSFFPVPPDVLLGPMCLGNRRKAFWFALVCTVGSVLGGVLGYVIGRGIWEIVKPYAYAWIPGFTPDVFEHISELYRTYDFWILFGFGFTPLPYKVATVAAGACALDPTMFILASAIGRSMRFFLVAGLMWKFGPPIVRFIDRYFNLVCIAFVILLIGGFAVLKLFGGEAETP